MRPFTTTVYTLTAYGAGGEPLIRVSDTVEIAVTPDVAEDPDPEPGPGDDGPGDPGDETTEVPALPAAFAWALGLAVSAMGARRLRRR